MSGMGFGGMDAVMMQLRIEVLEQELARSREATDIAVNGARSATFELSRVQVLHADALLGWAAERARAEKLREVVQRVAQWHFQDVDEACLLAETALADTEVKP